jgi:archaellum component FlaC
MPDVGERLDKVEQRLTDISQRMDEQFAKVYEQFAKVDDRFAHVDQRFTQLQVLVEESASQIKLVAEVQGHHGETLQRLNDAVEPLKALQPVFEKVVKDHEERSAGARPPVSSRSFDEMW